MATHLTNAEEDLLEQAKHIQRFLDGLAIPTRDESGQPLNLVARINMMTARCVKAKKDLAESRYLTAAALEVKLNAAEEELVRLRSRNADVEPVMARIPSESAPGGVRDAPSPRQSG